MADFVKAALQRQQFCTGLSQRLLGFLHHRQHIGADLLPDGCVLVHGVEDGTVELAFIQRRRGMAVFCTELQPGDTPPDDALFSVSGPCHPLVGGTALTAHQQFRQGVFAGIFSEFRLAALLQHLSLAGAARHFFPHQIECLS